MRRKRGDTKREERRKGIEENGMRAAKRVKKKRERSYFANLVSSDTPEGIRKELKKLKQLYDATENLKTSSGESDGESGKKRLFRSLS